MPTVATVCSSPEVLFEPAHVFRTPPVWQITRDSISGFFECGKTVRCRCHEASHAFDAPGITLRADIINLFDKVYEIRDGSGVGVGAPQYGPRRGVFVGVSKTF